MTSSPAKRLGLLNRGLIKQNHAADIVVFNPETIMDMATYDNPTAHPVGIEYVFVNGQLVVDRGKHTGVLSGHSLTRNFG